MKVLLFGATGMVGQGVLIECLRDDRVESVTAIGRGKSGRQHPKLREIAHKNLFDFSSLENELAGIDACFFCLGIASAGMKEEDYRRITKDIAVAAADTLAKLNPNLVFVFVSGTGTDSTEKGRIMWARVKGEAENALLRMPFKATYVFRPAIIQPMYGVKSRTRLYRVFYVLTAPIFPLVKVLFPKKVTTTERIGQAMINAVVRGYPKKILESPDINELASTPPGRQEAG